MALISSMKSEKKNHLLMGEGSWWVEWLENRSGHELGVVNSEAGSL